MRDFMNKNWKWMLGGFIFANIVLGISLFY